MPKKTYSQEEVDGMLGDALAKIKDLEGKATQVKPPMGVFDPEAAQAVKEIRAEIADARKQVEWCVNALKAMGEAASKSTPGKLLFRGLKLPPTLLARQYPDAPEQKE